MTELTAPICNIFLQTHQKSVIPHREIRICGRRPCNGIRNHRYRFQNTTDGACCEFVS